MLQISPSIVLLALELHVSERFSVALITAILREEERVRFLFVQVMRHGEAEAKSGLVRDDERRLTQVGTAQVQAVLDMSKLLGSKVDTILSSPLARAKETAEIARRELGVDKYNVDQVLEPDRTPYEVFKRLSDFPHQSTILLVTHQPLVSRLVSSLLNWDESFFMMPAGAIASLHLDGAGENATGKLSFLIPPPPKA